VVGEERFISDSVTLGKPYVTDGGENLCMKRKSGKRKRKTKDVVAKRKKTNLNPTFLGHTFF